MREGLQSLAQRHARCCAEQQRRLRRVAQQRGQGIGHKDGAAVVPDTRFCQAQQRCDMLEQLPPLRRHVTARDDNPETAH